MKKKFSIIVTLLLCFSMLAGGCGKKVTTEDAQTYVQATLDAYYKGIYDAYMEKTECTEEEAKSLHEEVVNMNLEASGLESSLNEESVEKLRQLFSDVFSNCKYSVENAQEDGDGFTVDVIVEPFLLNYDQIENQMLEELQNVDPETIGALTEDEIIQYSFDLMYDIMSERLTTPEYGEPETFAVHIQPDSDGVLMASEDDLAQISESLIAL